MPIDEIVVVDDREISLGHHTNLPGGIDPAHALEGEPLSRTHIEAPLAAVPVSGEHDGLRLHDTQRSIFGEPGVDADVAPVQ